MEKYQFDPAVKSSLENSPVPFAVYQFIDRRVNTLILSKGFLDLFGFEDREEAYFVMDNDMYRSTHPDDMSRIADAAFRFATEGGEYNVVYRSRAENNGRVTVIHAQGRHVYTETGERLAYVWYAVEGDYEEEEGESAGSLDRSFNQMLREGSMTRKIRYDTLTGLPNMTYFFELAEDGIRSIRMSGKKPVILFLDFCGMKAFNNKWGFAEGDKLIRAFGYLLAGHFGNENCARFGQDHFAVLTEEEGIRKRLKELFEAGALLNEGKTLPIRAGIYRVTEDSIEIGAVCDRAKIACDLNRSAQKSCFRYFDEKMLQDTVKKQYIIENLDRALAEGWITVYYQAIVRASDGKVCDEEALSRWIDPVRGFLSPADFIPTLEEARLIYKLDLYVVERVLEKLKKQAEAGLYPVPQSVNLSRTDFDSCDIVEEIRQRVDAAGIDRAMLTIEITESTVGSDFEFIREQVKRFQELGFRVWMDDFGSGYSSLDVLQQIRFDLIKFDMRFMEHFEKDEAKIILTELTKMAAGLGIDTVCEGVEKKEQVDFLCEIGCTKIQGYYYGKPMAFESILARARDGAGPGYENPAEADYYSAIGRINLYDVAVLASEGDESLERYFHGLPMAIMEVNGTKAWYKRCNRSYRDFMKRIFGAEIETDFVIDGNNMPNRQGTAFMGAIMRCSHDGNRSLIDEQVDEKRTIHAFMRRIAVNPVTGSAAVAVAVLAETEAEEGAGASYESISRALSSDYMNLYYVDLETEEFIEYTSDASRENLSVERRGTDFFSASAKDAQMFIYKEDREYFLESFTKENILRTLDEQGTFTLSYRLQTGENPIYVSMKAVRMPTDRGHIIIGVSNVDAQMRQKEEMARLQAEQITYARINALSRDYICIYTVNPDTDRYVEYGATADYSGLNVPKEGDDFYATSRVQSERVLWPEDVARFQELITKERIMEEIRKNGIFTMRYRMNIDGEPRYTGLKATLIEEQDGPQLIIGVTDIDAQVRREQEYERRLAAARSRAHLDILTGVKNKNAYENMSHNLDRQVEVGQDVHYAIALCRVDGLAEVNEEHGREAGDQLIRDACAIVCNVFKHSPVFRVAGDQFAAVAQGHDYQHADELADELKEISRRNRESGGVVISCGLAKYDGTASVASVFERADRLCREEK